MSNRITPPQRLILACAISVLMSLPTTALGNTLEERLRTQLRATAQELQALQGQHSRAEAARVAAESQRDAAQQEVARLRSQLESANRSGEQLRRNATQQIEARNDQLKQFRGAYDELLQITRDKEAERMALQNALTLREGQLVMCTDKNTQLYDAAHEVLRAYEDVSVSDVLRTRQPFAAAARVRFDEIVQQHGDALYDGRFDPLMQPAPAQAETAPQAESSEAESWEGKPSEGKPPVQAGEHAPADELAQAAEPIDGPAHAAGDPAQHTSEQYNAAPPQ